MRRMTTCLLLLLALGCEEKKPMPAGPEVEVAGKVLHRDGSPLGEVMLRFQREPPDPIRLAMLCPVKEDGTFKARCLPGTYRVTLVRKAEKGGQVVWELEIPPNGTRAIVLQEE